MVQLSKKNQALLDRIVDPLTGIIKELRVHLAHPGEPQVFGARAVSHDILHYRVTGKSTFTKSATGAAGWTAEHAIMGATGEAMERAYAGIYELEEFTVGSYKKVAEHAIPFELLRFYSDSQYQGFGSDSDSWVQPFTEDSELTWVTATSLLNDRKMLLPAQVIYLPYLVEDNEPLIVEQASTGLAAGQTKEQAILSALCEIIERDTLMGCWLNRVPARQLEVEGTALEILISERFDCDHLDIRLYELPNDTDIPVMIAAIRDINEPDEHLIIGMGCHPKAEMAAKKALLEAGQGRLWIRQLIEAAKELEEDDTFSNIVDFEHHIWLYANAKMVRELDFFLKDRPIISMDSFPVIQADKPADLLKLVLNRLSSIGLEPFVVPIAEDELSQIGLHVLRVFVPQMIPMNGNHAYRPLGLKRVYEYPNLIGRPDLSCSRDVDLNPLPHPYP